MPTKQRNIRVSDELHARAQTMAERIGIGGGFTGFATLAMLKLLHACERWLNFGGDDPTKLECGNHAAQEAKREADDG